MHSLNRLHELPVYLPVGWRVVPRWDRLILIAPNPQSAEALCLGAARHVRGTSERLNVPIEIHWRTAGIGCLETLE